MTKAVKVEIGRRFARSARIDADLGGTPPLVGYVLQASVAKALRVLALSQIESGQGAFTWTGPYGGGKSSAALLVANLVAGAKANRTLARSIVGDELAGLFEQAFPARRTAWSVVPVTGSRNRLREAVADAAGRALDWSEDQIGQARASDAGLIELLLAGAKRSGLLLILDELGKLLEHEALEGGDVHLLQDLAERASRSSGRLVVIGILHQAFDQYAARASRDARLEWAKVQGRFHDIPFLSGADETVALLGQAICCERRPSSAKLNASVVAKAVAKRRPTDIELLEKGLAATWPLNPVTALLLGPVSRQRFAQNERSLFGFLSSSEPFGFQEFLASRSEDETYGPERLWDYLVANFGMALASGPDGSRFSLAFEAIERAGAKGADLHVRLTKSAAIIELFRNGSGLAVSDDYLASAVPGASSAAIAGAIQELLAWAILIPQPRLKGYALFSGSDFDLADAIYRTSAPLDSLTLNSLAERVGSGFASAKRHYFETGALRTFEIRLELVEASENAADVAARIAGRSARGSGVMALLIGRHEFEGDALSALAATVAADLKQSGAVACVAAFPRSGVLSAAAVELAALERVIREHPQLEGDRIARREIAARQSALIDELQRQIEAGLGRAQWWLGPDNSTPFSGSVPAVASKLADAAFPHAPILKSELLQRDRPSSNAMGALRDLCHAMVGRPQVPALGIDGFPAERGLYLNVLEPFGLHREGPSGFDFYGPDESPAGRSLQPAWELLGNSSDIRLGELFDRWAAPPFGIKKGVMPVLVLAFLLANRERAAVYIEDIFQTVLDDLFVDKLLQKPDAIRIRAIDRSLREMAFLGRLAELLQVEHRGASLPVARALYQRFEKLPLYSRRTDRVSEEARVVRSAVLKSTDPEALLFDAIPSALGDKLSAETVSNALCECEQAYPGLLEEMRQALARALGVDPITFAGVKDRAAAIKALTSDLSFDAFAMRAAAFESGDGEIEGLTSLLLHKPATSWSDREREEALTVLARYGRRFRELEALAVVRDRRSQTEALALVVGLDPKVPPLVRSFELTESEKGRAAALAEELLQSLKSGGEDRQLQLAALARAVASLSADAESDVGAAA